MILDKREIVRRAAFYCLWAGSIAIIASYFWESRPT